MLAKILSGFIFLLVACPLHLHAQTADSLLTSDIVIPSENTPDDYQASWKRTVMPVSLIGIGAIGLAPGFIRHGSHEVTRSIMELRGNSSPVSVDDYLQYLPVAGAVLLGTTGIQARHSLLDRTLITATSYATLGVLTKAGKILIDERRPQYEERNSFPSGHSAVAFMGAELMRIEYGGWYGVGAYTLAAGIGFMRMYNGKHWLHDVVAGAGVGILSARIGEWSCCLWNKLLDRQKKKPVSAFTLTPLYNPCGNTFYGFSMGCTF